MRNLSNNPVFKRINNADYAIDGAVATYKGVAGKVLFYIGMLLIGAFGGLILMQTNESAFAILLTISLSTTFIFSLVALLSTRLAKVFGTLYCLAIGMVVGIVSLAFEMVAPGSVMIAILATIVVLVVVSTLFLTNIIKVNGRFMRFLVTFSISIMVTMLLMWILSATVYSNQAFNFRNNTIVSLVMVFLATLYLLFDLEHIRQVVEGGAPKMMEWYVAFGLVFTIVWLYMEILPVIARYLARDN